VPDPISATLTSRVRRPGSDAEPPPGEGPARARRLWSVLPACAGFAVFGVIVWLAYQDASLGPPIGEPPLIKAAAEPVKLPPEQAEQTTLAAEQGAVGRLWSDSEQTDQPERLLPPPEEPLSPPTPEQPARAELAPEQPAGQPADAPAMGAAGEDGAGGVRAGALPSAGPAADIPDSASLQSPTDESVQEAEAALDRLLAEVTASAEDTDAPGATGSEPAADQGTVKLPPDREESPTREPATATAAAPRPGRATPAAPPPKPAAVATSREVRPAAEAPAAVATSREVRPAAEAPAAVATSSEVRPAAAVTAAPAADLRARERPTETAALTGPRAPLPIAAGGDYRIQLAAVRGQSDAKRAWDLFMADLRPVLGEVAPIFERAETANGVFYRVQIGPFASQQTAESLCEELKQHNASCFVIRR
jgi:SPOR domain